MSTNPCVHSVICFNLKQMNATDKAAPVLGCPGLCDLVNLLQLPPDGGDVLVEVLQRPLPPEGVLGPGGGAGAGAAGSVNHGYGFVTVV